MQHVHVARHDWTHAQLYYQPPFIANEQETRHMQCDTTCNGTKATRTSYIEGMTTPFVECLRLPITLVNVGCAYVSSCITSRLSHVSKRPNLQSIHFFLCWVKGKWKINEPCTIL